MRAVVLPRFGPPEVFSEQRMGDLFRSTGTGGPSAWGDERVPAARFDAAARRPGRDTFRHSWEAGPRVPERVRLLPCDDASRPR